jgi:molybdopterin synthase sulfur carrier subunit
MRDHPPVTVTLVLLARLREVLGSAGETLELRGGEACVGDVLATLRRRGGGWAHELAPGRAVRVAVNHAMVGEGAPVRDGDEVALFPPVTGG